MLDQQKEPHLAFKVNDCPTPSPTFYTLDKTLTRLRERTLGFRNCLALQSDPR